MNRTEMMDYLILRLIQELPHCSNISLPANETEKWSLLRSLMNVRRPGPVDEEFVGVQDSLLMELTAEKGIVDALVLPPIPGENRLSLWQGDITTLKIDAIVNAANSDMLGCFQPCHNCIDNTIHTYAGVQLRNECDALMREQGHEEAVALHPNSPAAAAGLGREPTGSAKITKGYNLPTKHVIHTVGPIISGSIVTKEDERLLASCYRSCLELAVRNGLASIAFCCISTGVFRFPKSRAARIAYDTVRVFLASDTQIERVVFCVFADEDRAIYQNLMSLAL